MNALTPADALTETERTRILAKAAIFAPPLGLDANGRRDLVGLTRDELAQAMLTIGEIGAALPLAPIGSIAASIPSRLAASSALISKLAGSGLRFSCSRISLFSSSLRKVRSASPFEM